ncbi:hypothetical protein VTO73DRAFT_4187 [Trametes versicolor]
MAHSGFVGLMRLRPGKRPTPKAKVLAQPTPPASSPSPPPRLADATKKKKRSDAVQPPVSSTSTRTKGKERALPEGSSGEEENVAPAPRANGKHPRDAPASEEGSEDDEDAPEPVSKRFRPHPTIHFDSELIREYELVVQCSKYVPEPAICVIFCH